MASRSKEKGNLSSQAVREAGVKGQIIGAALMTEAFAPLLLKSSKPYLLNISSGLGSLTRAEDPQAFDYTVAALAYRMSKSALNMLVVQESKHLGKGGVHVFAVCPGLVESNLRGTAQEQRKAGGHAGDPRVSAHTIRSIIEGERDADVGKFVHKDGVYPW